MDLVFNVALGQVKTLASLPAANDAIIVVLLKAAGLESDAVLADHDTLAAILAAANDEADFTNYVRKTATTVTVTVDDTGNLLKVTADDITWVSAGGASNNSLGKLLFCYDPDTTGGTDADIVPLTAHDFVITTAGNNLDADLGTDGWYQSRQVSAL